MLTAFLVLAGIAESIPMRWASAGPTAFDLLKGTPIDRLTGVLILGTNEAATDTVGTAVMGYDPRPPPELRRSINAITRC